MVPRYTATKASFTARTQIPPFSKVLLPPLRSQKSPSSQTVLCCFRKVSHCRQTRTTIVPLHTWFHVFFKHMFKSLHVVQWWGVCLPSLIPSTTLQMPSLQSLQHYSQHRGRCQSNDHQEMEIGNTLPSTTKYQNLHYSKTTKGHYNYEMPKMENPDN